jgi:hypothetical protein
VSVNLPEGAGVGSGVAGVGSGVAGDGAGDGAGEGWAGSAVVRINDGTWQIATRTTRTYEKARGKALGKVQGKAQHLGMSQHSQCNLAKTSFVPSGQRPHRDR